MFNFKLFCIYFLKQKKDNSYRMYRKIIIRNIEKNDFDAVRSLQQKVYPHMRPWSLNQLENHLIQFPEGQIIAEFEGQIVGTASSLIIQWNEYTPYHSWKEVTGAGSFDTHNKNGLTLYGAEVCVDPEIRRQGIGNKLYKARKDICRRLNLKRIIAAGRIPNYHLYADKMTAHEYAMHVIWGDIYDPVLRFQIKEGFQFCDVIENYLVGDNDSLEYATLIVWLNQDYKENKRKVSE